MKCQLVILGPAKAQYGQALQACLEKRLKLLGLVPAEVLEVLDVSCMNRVDPEAPYALVWFGCDAPANPHEIAVLSQASARKQCVFPVHDGLGRFDQVIPATLHRINGHRWPSGTGPESAEACGRLVGNILTALRLIRPARRTFITFKRTDTSHVASQLFDSLTHRRYHCFLDTASLEAGVDFQESLWNRMADVDMLIFLDSPNALSSTWVHQELAQAHDLGLGVLQLI
jgi:hypothetical protein